VAPDDRRRLSSRGTVRFRVTALATVAVIIVLAVSGFVLVTLQRDTLTQTLDDSLVRHADSVTADLSGPRVPERLDPRGDEDTTAQLVGDDGVVLAASANVEGARRLSALSPRRQGDALHDVAAVARLRGPQRLLVRRLFINGRPATLYMSVPLEDINRNTVFLTRTMLAGIPIMAAILAGVVWWLVGRTLRPVERMRTQVSEISGTDTYKRVPEPDGNDEITRLAQTMNQMLGRIDEAAVRQQRFVADASHELRTPLTRMRSEIEVDLSHPGSADQAATTCCC